jgi:hypothetical protein
MSDMLQLVVMQPTRPLEEYVSLGVGGVSHDKLKHIGHCFMATSRKACHAG